MKSNSFWKAVPIALTAALLAACGNSVEGTYTMVKGPVKGVKLTLGKNTFSMDSGASGNYEVSGDNVIFTGYTFAGTMHLEGKDLVNENFRFNRD
ncbi:hypothetical protein [Pseudomonas bohemica]|uniref:hypothetical protein n=1 Tax=Pseudomonas bohemica TaxID=2044872 RepID=UPI000DA5FB1E|nr:hypothetical protein [Pseudomonas bohemica]